MLKSLKDLGTLEILTSSGLKAIRGGDTTREGQSLTRIEEVFDENGKLLGHNRYYRKWTSDETTGENNTDICYYGVTYPVVFDAI